MKGAGRASGGQSLLIPAGRVGKSWVELSVSSVAEETRQSVLEVDSGDHRGRQRPPARHGPASGDDLDAARRIRVTRVAHEAHEVRPPA